MRLAVKFMIMRIETDGIMKLHVLHDLANSLKDSSIEGISTFGYRLVIHEVRALPRPRGILSNDITYMKLIEKLQ